MGVGRAMPDAEGLAKMLAAMVERGCLGGVIEVSSEALRRQRVEGLAFDAAVVTDLAGVGASELAAVHERRRFKARLFRKLVPGGAAVVNADDPHAELLGAVNLDARRVSYALERPANVTAKIERLDQSGTRFLLRGFDREAAVALRLIGAHHVEQALAAAAVAWARGLTLDAVVAGLESVSQVAGRLEAVARRTGLRRPDRPGAHRRRAPAGAQSAARPRCRPDPLRPGGRGAPGPRACGSAWPRPPKRGPTA